MLQNLALRSTLGSRPREHRKATGVWFECSSLSRHCSEVRGSTSVGAGFPQAFTRPAVWGPLGMPAEPSGTARAESPTERRKVTWFR